MSTLTTNLGLVKPSGNERPQVSVINANMDVLDAVIGDPSNLRSGSDITSDIKALRDSVAPIVKNGNASEIGETVTNTYTCPADGWYSLLIDSQDGRVAQFLVSGVILLGISSGSVVGAFPFKKDTVISVRGGLNNTTYTVTKSLSL